MTTKTLASSLAALALFAVQGAIEPVWPEKPVGDLTTKNAVGFENFDVGTTPAATLADDGQVDTSKSYFLYQGTSGDDNSIVTNYENGATLPQNVPAYFSGLDNNKYLSLSTEGGTLFRSLNVINTSGETPALGQAEEIQASGLFVDTLVQFTPCEEAPSVESGNKLAIWLNVFTNAQGEAESTNLCVKAGYWVYENDVLSRSDATYTLANTGDIDIQAGEWVRLTVKAIRNVYSADNIGVMPAFQIYINDELAVFNEDAGTAAALAQIGTLEAAALTALESNTILPSMQAAYTLQAVGFQGTGAVDDFVVTTEDPYAEPVNFTLFWDANILALESYLQGESDPVEVTIANLSHVFEGMGDGDTLEIDIPTTAYSDPTPTTVAVGYEIDWANTVLTNVNMEAVYEDDEDPTTLYAYKFTLDGAGPYSVTLVTKSSTPVQDFDGGSGTELDPYIVGTAKSFNELLTKVAAGDTFEGKFFELSGNVDFSALGLNPFAGIGEYNSATAFFAGTFDGKGYKLMNVDLSPRSYAGVFNQVKGGTVKNLTVSNITCSTYSSGNWSCSIVGTAASGATLQNLVAEGDFGTEAAPCTHNAAGIAIRADIEANSSVSFIDCTNNASIVTRYTKVAGILGISQARAGTLLTLTRCVNNGSVKKLDGSNGDGGVAGIVAYLSGVTGQGAGDVVFDSCESLGSVVTTADPYHQLGTMIGYNSGRPVTLQGTNIARADTKSYGQSNDGTSNSATNALAFATVDGGVATFGMPALDGTTNYCMAVNNMAFPLAVGDTLTIDTSIAAFDDANVGPALLGVYLQKKTEGSVTTYTVTAPIDASDAVIALSSDSAVWGNELAFPDVTLTLNGEPIAAADYMVAWSPSTIAAMQEGDPDATYTATATITGSRYVAGTTKQATFTVTAPSSKTEINPGDDAVVVEATSADEATNKVDLVIADAAAEAAGQAAVVKLVATPVLGQENKWSVSVAIDTNAVGFVDPDVAVADVATNLATVAVAVGSTVSITIPAADVTPGLYYSVAMVTDLATADAAAWAAGEGARALAGASHGADLTLVVPKPTSGTKAFYKVLVNMVDSTPPPTPNE